MYTGYPLIRLVHSWQGIIHIGRRIDLNGWPIHHLVVTSIVRRAALPENGNITESKKVAAE